jgi:hypothetical protein
MNIESIAKTCYAANRAYSETLGASSLPNWENANNGARESLKHRVTHTLGVLKSGGGHVGTIAASAGVAELETEQTEMTYGNPIKDAIFTAVCRAFADTPQPA